MGLVTWVNNKNVKTSYRLDIPHPTYVHNRNSTQTSFLTLILKLSLESFIYKF